MGSVGSYLAGPGDLSRSYSNRYASELNTAYFANPSEPNSGISSRSSNYATVGTGGIFLIVAAEPSINLDFLKFCLIYSPAISIGCFSISGTFRYVVGLLLLTKV